MTLAMYTRSPNGAVTSLLFVALMWCALIPAGFMTAFGAGVGVPIQLCTGIYPAPDQGHPGHGTATRTTPCLYSVSGLVAPLPSLKVSLAAAPAVSVWVGGAVSLVVFPSIVRAQMPRSPPPLVQSDHHPIECLVYLHIRGGMTCWFAV